MKHDKNENVENVENVSAKKNIKKPIIIAVAIVLLVAIVLSLAYCMTSCNENEDPKPPITSSSDVPVVNDEVEDDVTSEDVDSEEEGESDEGEFDESSIIIERPYSDGSISSGVMPGVELDKKPVIKDPDEGIADPGNPGDDDTVPIWLGTDFETLTTIPAVEYTEFIQLVGNDASTNKRSLYVNNSASGVLSTDFTGISCCYFPTMGSYSSQINDGQSDAYVEINTKRMNDGGYRFARTWFQIDWMVTNELEKQGKDYKDYANNWEGNPDYVNYMNGVYSWENDEFLSFVESCKMMEETGCEVYLAFGWKIGERVQDWFGCSPYRPFAAAPKDTKAYAKAAAALFRYMRQDVGLTNFNILSFYNEPSMKSNFKNGGVDFYDIGDNRVTFLQMVRDCYKEFQADPTLKDVEIMAADTANDILTNDSFDNHNVYLKNHASQEIDAYTFHYYYPHWQNWVMTPGTYSPYEELHKVMVIMRKMLKDEDHKVYLTEFYASSWEDSTWSDAAYQGWEGSECGYFLATANAGINGLFKWGVVGGYIDAIDGIAGECGRTSWLIPKNRSSVSVVRETYYLETILNNYVDRNANLLDIEWSGKDMHCGAYSSADGKDLAIVIDGSDKAKTARTLSIKLEKSLGGKNIYVYKHTQETVCDGNATIPTAVETIENVTDNFTFKIPGGYGAYVLSTKAPVKQIAFFVPGSDIPAAFNDCAVNGTVDIGYNRIDAETSDEIVWEVKRYSVAAEIDSNGVELKRARKGANDDLGTISDNGAGVITYTPAADAKVGDTIAIRGTYKGTNRFASAIIQII